MCTDSQKRKWKLRSLNVSPELEQLEKILHFPEELALALAETEAQLFCQVHNYTYANVIFSAVGFTIFISKQENKNKSSPSPFSLNATAHKYIRET